MKTGRSTLSAAPPSLTIMRFTRHAKNRLRWLRRSLPTLSELAIAEAIRSGRERGRDSAGNLKVAVHVGSSNLVIVLDETQDLVITIWKEA